MTPTPLLTLTDDELRERVLELGGRAFHAKVVRKEVLGAGRLDYGEMTSLPMGLREALAEHHPILAGREVSRSTARDGTTKLLLHFDRPPGPGPEGSEGRSTEGTDPETTVETVHIPSHRDGRGATLCVSTQIGCPVACPFCASGLLGLTRNLAAHEILEQYLRGRALGALSRSVVMGIGEPLLNAKALVEALTRVHDDMGIGARKITVSTVGFPDRVRRLAEDRPPFQLAVSLHTPFDAQRDELVPVMAGTPIEEILDAAEHWFETTGREPTYEVVLLAGETDTFEHAEALVARLGGRRCTVNLIPFNPVGEAAYRRPHPEDVERFQNHMNEHGVVTTVRWSRGLESDAACGQLRIHQGT